MITETLMIAATTGVCSYVAGIVTMGLVGARKVATLTDKLFYAEADREIGEGLLRVAGDVARRKGREVADLRAEIFALNAIEHARQSGLREHNAKSHAKRLEREAAAVALRNARHAEMRATLELI